jgi:hypothetical protein
MSSEIIISSNETSLRSMMIKLMGRGLTLSHRVEGQFVLNFNDIIDLINRISQRVNLQNHCKMSDFHAEFSYDDGSKETIPSFEYLEAYRSVNPTLCNSGKLSFAFLIDFNSRGVEKQSIDIIISGNKKTSKYKIESYLNDNVLLGNIEIHIEYTDVTWANDIKNLFEKYCQTHVEKLAVRQKLAPFFSTRFLPILSLPLMFLGIFAIEYSKTTVSIKDRLGDYLRDIPVNDFSAIINRKLDVLIYKENDVRSYWDIVTPVTVLTLSLVAIALCAIIIRNIPVSTIVLSEDSRKVYERLEKRRSRSNIVATMGIVVSIGISVVASKIDRAFLSLFGF